MPTKTFFNLPEAKRQRLMDAVWEEFSTYPYAEASINRIIQAADISRGSFYQYFSGKQDVFSYLLQILLRHGEALFRAQLTAHRSDLFAAMLGMYDILLWQSARCADDEEQNRFRSLLRLNLDLDHNLLTNLLDLDALTRQSMELLAQNGYPMETPGQCQAVLYMLLNLGLTALHHALQSPEYEPRYRELLEAQLSIIQHGIRRKGDLVC